MKISILKDSSIDNRLIDTILSVAIYIFTFPVFDPSLSPGLDPSYMWAFNYLFIHDYNQLTITVFPYGPLGFLKMPAAMGINFQLAILFFSLLKIGILYGLFRIARIRKLNTLIAIGLLTLFGGVVNLDLLIISATYLLCVVFLEKKKLELIIAASVIAGIGFCIKISIGVSSFSILAIGLLSQVLKSDQPRTDAVKAILFSALTVFITGLVIFLSPLKFIDYFIFAVKFSGQFSSSLAFYAENNWLYLALVLCTVIIPFIRTKGKKDLILIILLLPVLFAMWKHAMSRQDTSHVNMLYSFLFVYWILIIVLVSKQRLLYFLTGIASMFFFHKNMQLMAEPPEVDFSQSGFGSFNQVVIHMSEFLDAANETTISNFEEVRLSQEAFAFIGDKSVDVLPWELSMIAANGLNWKPKRTMQVGSFAPWLDELSLEDYKNDGPEIIILKMESDLKGGNLGSVDGRYLLNDNPSVYEFLDLNYQQVYIDDKVVILSKSEERSAEYLEGEWTNTSWGEVIPIAEGNNVSLKLKVEKSLFGRVRNFLFRSGNFYVNYHFADGMIIQYPFLPIMASEGIRLSPHTRFPNAPFTEEIPIAISFETDAPYDVENSLEMQFVQNMAEPTPLFSQNKDRENKEIIGPEYDLLNGTEVLSEETFSKTLRFSLDTIWDKQDSDYLLVEVYSEYTNPNSKASLVIALDEVESGFWIPQPLIQSNSTEHSYLSKLISKSEYPEGRISIYVWNHGKAPMKLDKIKIRASN